MFGFHLAQYPLYQLLTFGAPSKAAHMMLQSNVKHLLVVDKSNVNKPIGIITTNYLTRI
jgi:hypothetical protein